MAAVQGCHQLRRITGAQGQGPRAAAGLPLSRQGEAREGGTWDPEQRQRPGLPGLALTCCAMTSLGNTHWAGWPGWERLCTDSIPSRLVSFLTRYTWYQSFPACVQKCSTCRRYSFLSSAIARVQGESGQRQG